MKNKKRWYKSVSNWVVIAACVILIPILIMNLSIMYQANKDKDTVPSVFGYKPFIVLSGSMETEIKRGDLIITKIVDARDEQGTVTTHRIIEIVERDGEKYFMTKGDNNSSQDHNLVALSDVEGIYVTRIPSVGNMLSSLANPTTIVIVVLAITVIFAISFMISTKRGINQERLEFLEYKRQKELEENKSEDNK